MYHALARTSEAMCESPLSLADAPINKKREYSNAYSNISYIVAIIIAEERGIQQHRLQKFLLCIEQT